MTSLLTNGIQSALLLYREQYGSEICGEQRCSHGQVHRRRMAHRTKLQSLTQSKGYYDFLSKWNKYLCHQ